MSDPSGSGLNRLHSDFSKWNDSSANYDLNQLNTWVGSYNFLYPKYNEFNEFKFEPRLHYGMNPMGIISLLKSNPMVIETQLYWYDPEKDEDVLLTEEQATRVYNRLVGVVEEEVDKFLIDSGNNSNDILNQDEPAQDEIMSMMEVDGEEIDTADCLVCANCFEDLEYEDSAWKDGDPYHKDCLKEIEKTGFDYSEYLD